MKNLSLILVILSLTTIYHSTNAQKKNKGEQIFLKHADEALSVLEQAASEFSMKGVAIVAFIPGETTQSWTSKMKVVSDLTRGTSNLLGIAQSKAAEMARTLQNSGSAEGEPFKGEFGYIGGVIQKVTGGYVFAVFSGAKGEMDVAVSEKGLAVLASYFK